MKKTILLLIILTAFFLNSQSAHAEEGSFIVCDILSYDFSYDYQSGNLFLSCSGDSQSLELHRINPDSLQVEQTYELNGLIQQVSTINNGNNLLVLISEYDGDRFTEEGILYDVDYHTGDILRTLYFDKSPGVMVIDPTESYAFIAKGIKDHAEVPPKLVKVSLSSFQIVEETIFGKWVRSMAITPDGSKLYVQTLNIYDEYPGMSARGIGVFHTADLEMITRFPMNTVPNHLAMSSDGSLLFISSHNYRETDAGADLYVLDTSTDEIIENLRFFYNGVETGTTHLVYSSQYNRLYCTAAPKVDYAFRYSNLVLVLDLTDYSYNYFEMGGNPLGGLALAQTANGPRLFAIEEGTPVVHYKDVKCLFNQDPICVLEVVTPMPYRGSLPAAITFDASNSYDPDGHEVAYHWDFNGDGIFDGVGDEYTGEPWNPTHQFMSYGIHVVMLKVMDECDGECYAVVEVTINPEHS